MLCTKWPLTKSDQTWFYDIDTEMNLHLWDENSLETYLRQNSLRVPAEFRLAFRELGMTIGLRGVQTMMQISEHHSALCSATLREEINALGRHIVHARTIEDFWREPRNQRVRSWQDHHDINDVMLATSLLPDEFLAVASESGPGARSMPPPGADLDTGPRNTSAKPA